MSRVLVTYASTHGQTEKIARRIAESIEASGQAVEVLPVAAEPDPSDYGGVVAGASLHAGKHQSEMTDWIGTHRDSLAARPGAFFSVSLTAAEETASEREPVVRIMRDYLEEAGWDPQIAETMAGALRYREYDRFLRTVIKLMMKRGGHPTDTSRDFEYTDWDQVEDFAARFAATVRQAAPSLDA
jgi:menaquinone-dependent protoporphyrinogen oxidase